LTATLTAKPANFSEFQRTPVDKKLNPGSNESACEDHSSGLEAWRETAKKSPLGGYVPSGFFVCMCLSPRFYPGMTCCTAWPTAGIDSIGEFHVGPQRDNLSP